MQAIKAIFGIGVGLVLGLVAIGFGMRLFRSATAPPTSVAVAPAPADFAPSPPPPPDPEPPSVEQIIDEHARELAALEGDALAAHLEDFAATASDATYPMLERNAAAWIGEPAMFVGMIAQIQDEPGTTIIRLATGGYGQNIVWVETSPSCIPDRHLVERSRVRVYGYLAGNHMYESQARWTITLPALVAIAVVPSSMPSHVSARRREQLGLEPIPSGP